MCLIVYLIHSRLSFEISSSTHRSKAVSSVTKCLLVNIHILDGGTPIHEDGRELALD